MAKDPAVLFYTADFISGTITMTDEQRGKYILLLCIQHQKGFLTEKDMLKICKTYDIDIWDKFTKDGDQYYNERMKAETEKRLKYSESRRINRQKKDEEDKDMLNICKSYDKHMENENININIDNNRDIDKGGVGEKGEEKEEVKKEKPKGFVPPSLSDVKSFFSLKEVSPDDLDYKAERFLNFYDSKNWFVGKNKMVNWKSAASRSIEWEDKRQQPQQRAPAQRRGVSLSGLEQIRQELRRQ